MVKVKKSLVRGKKNITVKGKKNLRCVGTTKRKTKVVKSVLVSPFDCCKDVSHLVLPDRTADVLREALRGLQMPRMTPTYKEYCHLRGAERRDFLRTCRENFLAELRDRNPSEYERVASIQNALHEVVLGFNAVMRAVEKKSLAIVLFHGNESQAGKWMALACKSRSIPFAYVPKLLSILKSEATMAYKCKSCLCIAFRLGITDEQSRFNILYKGVLQLLGQKNSEVALPVDTQSIRKEYEETLLATVPDDGNHRALCEEAVRALHLPKRNDHTPAFVVESEYADSSALLKSCMGGIEQSQLISSMDMEKGFAPELESNEAIFMIDGTGGEGERGVNGDLPEYVCAQVKRVQSDPDRESGKKKKRRKNQC